MIIFLTGHRKSGTTLLHRLFDGHPDIDVYPTDFAFFYSYFPVFTEGNVNKKKLINRLLTITKKTINNHYLKYHSIEKKKLDFFNMQLKKKLEKINLKSKRDVFNTILLHWENLKGEKLKKIILIKETSQSIYFDYYYKNFKNIKMINIIRDPRDNYASIKSGLIKYYNKIGISYLQNFASVLFRSRQDLLSSFFNSNHKSFKIVSYESLVKNPKKIIKNLCNFLKIKYYNQLLEPTISGKKFYGNNFKNKLFGISKKNVNNWRSRITNQEKNIIEFYLNDVMRIYGYKCSKNLKKLNHDFSFFNDKINSKYFYADRFKK